MSSPAFSDPRRRLRDEALNLQEYLGAVYDHSIPIPEQALDFLAVHGSLKADDLSQAVLDAAEVIGPGEPSWAQLRDVARVACAVLTTSGLYRPPARQDVLWSLHDLLKRALEPDVIHEGIPEEVEEVIPEEVSHV